DRSPFGSFGVLGLSHWRRRTGFRLTRRGGGAFGPFVLGRAAGRRTLGRAAVLLVGLGWFHAARAAAAILALGGVAAHALVLGVSREAGFGIGRPVLGGTGGAVLSAVILGSAGFGRPLVLAVAC